MGETVTDQRGLPFRFTRQAANVTVRELAARDGNISHSTISRWERGERDISDATYQRLVSVLGDIIHEGRQAGATA